MSVHQRGGERGRGRASAAGGRLRAPLASVLVLVPVLVLVLVLVLAGCGDGATDPADPSGPGTQILALGSAHLCVLDREAAAWCWGRNGSGQLGTEDTLPRLDPARVPGGPYRAITAGWTTTCALDEDGRAWCWGSNVSGQVGDGTTVNRNLPVPVATEERFVEIEVGYQFVCGRTEPGRVWCWGRNRNGVLGDGTADSRPVPGPVAGDELFRDLTVGLAHSCGLTAGGAAHCWGSGAFGTLGGPEDLWVPTLLDGLEFRQLTAGTTTSCGVGEDGTSYCWGLDYFGTLGTGSVTGERLTSPTPLVAAPSFEAVRPGDANSILTPTCGLTGSGAAWCWGANLYGQLGTEATTETCGPIVAGTPSFGCSGTPLPVGGGHRFTTLEAGHGVTCAVTEDGALYCWGSNGNRHMGSNMLSRTCAFETVFEAPCTFEPVAVAPALELR